MNSIEAITLKSLAEFPQQLETHYATIPAAFKHWAPDSWEGVPSEQFTAIEQVCHVRDIEIEGYQVRFRRTLTEINPLLASIISEPLARERSYEKADTVAVFASLRVARSETLQIIASASELDLSRTAEFEGYGPLTFRSLVHYLCSHDQQHLSGLQWLLGKIHAGHTTPAQ